MSVGQPVPVEKPQTFTMPPNYRDWLEDLGRVNQAITALLYAHYALVSQNARKHQSTRRIEAMIHPDDIPIYEAIEEIHEAIEGLQSLCVGAGVPVAPSDREQSLRQEDHRHIHGDFTMRSAS